VQPHRRVKVVQDNLAKDEIDWCLQTTFLDPIHCGCRGVRLDMTDKKGCTGYSGLKDRHDAVLHHAVMDVDRFWYATRFMCNCVFLFALFENVA